MYDCDACKPQLLDHLYGLLDHDERAAVLAHLEGCADCRAALAAAESQRQALAEAARAEFPGVRFEPPMTPTLPLERPAPRVAKPRSALRRWQPWAVAASVLLLLGGFAAYAGVSWTAYNDKVLLAKAEQQKLSREQESLQRQQQTDAERAAQQARAIQEQLQTIEAKWRDEADKTKKELAKGIAVEVSGPSTVEAGARNEYKIETRRPGPPGALHKGTLTPARVDARVVNPATEHVYFRHQMQVASGNAQLVLPRDLPVEPGKQLVLVVEAEAEDGAQARVEERLPLVGSLYVTHLTTDRPMYRPGETVRFRSLTLERFSLKPPSAPFQLQYRVTAPQGGEVFKLDGTAEVRDDNGKAIAGPDGQPVRGLGAGEWQIPPGSAGGEYTLTVKDAANRFPPERRKFLVNQYQAPRLNKELEFHRKSYGPGEWVEANCKVSRVEGGKPLADQPVAATVNLDGHNVPVENAAALRTDDKGNVPTVRFKLPAAIERGQASLSVRFTDGANHEAIVRTVPIVLKKLLVDFYPEGGELVAGVPNRVYFQVRTTLNLPADLRGKLVDDRGNAVVSVATLTDDREAGVNQGMGAFTFTPQAGRTYELKIESPIGIEGRHALPAAKADGVVLNIPTVVARDSIDVVLHTGTAERRLLVGAYCRGRVLEHARVKVKPGRPAKLTLKPAEVAGGVCRVTVFEERGEGDKLQAVPVAERLIYRHPAEKANLAIRTDKKGYTPGDRVGVTVTAEDEKKQPAPVIVLLSVVDLSVLKLADEKTARSMPAHFFLTNEVQRPEDLEHADFLLGDHAKAAEALDLLLGTQGWRRFAEQDPKDFRKRQPERGERLLLASGLSPGREARHDSIKTRLAEVDQQFAPQFEVKQKELAKVEVRDEQQRVQAQQEAVTLQVAVQTTRQSIRTAEQELKDQRDWLLQAGLGLALVLLLVVSFGSLLIGMIRVSQGQRNAVPYLMTGLCCLLLLFLGGAGATVVWLGKQHDRTFAATEPAPAPMAGGPGEAVAMDQAGVEFAAPGAAMPEMAKDMPKMAMPRDDRGPVPPKMPPQPAPMPPVQVMPAPVPAEERLLLGPGNNPLADLAQAADPNMDMMPPGMMPPGGFPGGPVAGQMPPGWPAGDGPVMEPGFQRGGMGGQGRPMPFDRDRQLRRQGRFDVLMKERLNVKEDAVALEALARTQPLVVREYAHRNQASPDQVRRDFTETVCWHPVLVLPGGKAEVSFDLPDSVTRFQVQAWAHSLDGRLGATTAEIESRLPFTVEPKVPTEVTNSDKVTIPVAVANDTGTKRNVKLGVEAKNLTLLGDADRELTVAAGKRARELFTFRPSLAEGEAKLTLTGRSQPFGADRVERTFRIVPEGFPISNAASDMLEKSSQHTVTLPESWVKGSLKLQAQVYPSTLADLQKGLEGLLNEPCGCFEQSSTANYPNVLVLDYLKESDQGNAEAEKRARALLTSGYAKLTAFECVDPADRAKRGYEWFGQTAPPHEALTAYGLLQFRDMARVHPVDQAMLERTQNYLLGQRDGKGGFKKNPRALDSFGGAPEGVTNAYIVWALTESGTKADLGTELKALNEQAQKSKDPYFLSLVATSLVGSGQSADGVALLKKVAEMQKPEGNVPGAQTSITRSGGRDLEIETTGLAVLGWLKANRPADFNLNVQKAAKWLGQQRGGMGGFGSTQSTILALKALIAFTKENRKTAEAGELKLFVGDAAEPADTLKFSAGTQGVLEVAVKEELLKPGKNKVRVEITGKNTFPYTLAWSYNTLKPANPETYPVHLTANLDRAKAAEGETVKLTAVVHNKSGQGQGMAVAILGLPGGLQLPEDMKQLKEMTRLRDNDTKPGLISAWELRGRELVLYWRALGADEKVEVSLDLVCRTPGEYRGPASRAYLYYNADRKFWVDPLAVAIAPQAP